MAQARYQGQISGAESITVTSNIRSGFERSSASSGGNGRSVSVNSVSCEASKQDSTHFQPKDIEQSRTHREVQTRKFGPCEVNAQAKRLSHETGSERCLLFGANSGRSQKVSEIPISRCDLRVPVFTLRSVLGTSSIHQVTETSGCHPEIIGHPSGDIFGRPSTTPPRGCGTTEHFPHCNNPPYGLGLYNQTREMLSITRANNHLSGCTAELHRPDHSSPSGETPPIAVGVQGYSGPTVVLHAGAFRAVGLHESNCPYWDLGSTSPLSSTSKTVHLILTQERALHEIQELSDLYDAASINRTTMADLTSANPCQPDEVNRTSNRYDSINRRLNERLGSQLSSSEDRRSVAEGGIQGTHQCAGTEGCVSCTSSTGERTTISSSHSAADERYEGPWQLWACWCLQRNKCPFSAPVTDVLAFLAEQFTTRKLAYRTMGVYKACISQMHDPVDGLQLGSLPVVSRFMKGLFQLRPAIPRTCSTWNVGHVLRYLSSLEPQEDLSLKVLTLKLTTLLALTSAARAHEIAALDCNHLSQKADSMEFIIPTHVKNSRPYHPPRKIRFGRYHVESSICVVRCLEHYLQRTSGHRRHQDLLLSYVRPHNPVGSQTISRWLCGLLRLAGVGIDFTGHSTRAASTSEAVDSGVPIEVVLEAADRSSAQTFEKHYHKQVDKNHYAHKVLDAINS